MEDGEAGPEGEIRMVSRDPARDRALSAMAEAEKSLESLAESARKGLRRLASGLA